MKVKKSAEKRLPCKTASSTDRPSLKKRTFFFVLLSLGCLYLLIESYNGDKTIREFVQPVILSMKQTPFKNQLLGLFSYNISENITTETPFSTNPSTLLNGNIQIYDPLPTNGTIPNKFDKIVPYDRTGPKLKKILFWNDFYGTRNFGFAFGRQSFIEAKCKVDTCFTTFNREEFNLEEVDAVLWHFRSDDKSLPHTRSKHTRYVFVMMESAVHLFGDLRPFNGKFNWTMTYRLDSDIPLPYGRIVRRTHDVLYEPGHDFTANKTKLVAWFSSNCIFVSSQRHIIVNEMKRTIPVDIYGKCGKLKCDKEQEAKCLDMVERDYKFYLSFENSLCDDYVTEKFFGMMSLNIIPVVYGSGKYHLIAPPHSYINARDFETPTDLAKYLLHLDQNPEEYNKYFRWKNYYDVLNHSPVRHQSFCDLCQRLHEDDKPKTYEDIYGWFVTGSNCKYPGKELHNGSYHIIK